MEKQRPIVNLVSAAERINSATVAYSAVGVDLTDLQAREALKGIELARQKLIRLEALVLSLRIVSEEQSTNQPKR